MINRALLIGVVLVFSFLLVNCTSDVSNEVPHNQLIGSVWKLKTDAYIFDFRDDLKIEYFIEVCEPKWGLKLNGSYEYNENNIGKDFDTGFRIKILGGLRKGELVKVVKVLKNKNFENGITYIPIMKPLKFNKWVEGEELDGRNYYKNYDSWDKFYSQGILNPDYVERVE